MNKSISGILALAFMLALSSSACAQGLATINNLPPLCGMLGTDSSSPPKLTCNPVPTGSSVTVAGVANGCVTVSAGPNYVVNLTAGVKPQAGAYTFNAATDNCGSFPYTGAAAVNYTMPSTTGLPNGWGVAVGASGVGGQLTLVMPSGSTAKFYGGPNVFNKGQGATVQFDGANFWVLPGVSPAIANSNPWN